jgi:D-sedoheptulose 7-phosphate isomerase
MLKIAILESVNAKNSLLAIEKNINIAIDKIYKKIKNGGKVFLCGNGGSAADSQHLAAEFLIRLRPNINRNPIPAISLAMDTSTITACGNDYSFNKIFSRNLIALGSKKDVLIVLSTSGNSPNIIEVLKTAKKMNIFSISFLGNEGGLAKKYSDLCLIVGSNVTARIQESHIFLGHYIFQSIEDKLIEKL